MPLEGVDNDAELVQRQLAYLAAADGDAFGVLARLAEVVFPGGVGVGDAARLTWPEPSRPEGDADRSGAGADPHLELEAHIRKSEARFRSLVEQLPAVVFYAALGSDDNEAYVSPQIESLLGFTQHEWLTNPLLWYSQLHPDDHQVVIDAFTQGVQTGQPFRAEVRFFSRTGEEVWILGEARLIRDEAHRPAYFQGVAFDITATKRAQQLIAEADRVADRARAEAAQVRADAIASHNARLRQLNTELSAAKEEAEAAVRARTNFLTTMSHELRTPLNSVIVLSGLLADSELTATQRDMLRRMRLSSDHLLELINDVLEFSRLRAGRVELDSEPFELREWLKDSMDIVAPRAAEKGLQLRVEIAPDAPHIVRADQGRLRQVLLNLLGNAVKFTAAGFVSVSLRAAPVEEQRWEFQCTVADSGIGIKPEDAATLFDEFRQADSGISREFGGTGLGLTICKRLCELMDGHIWVEESAGPGATVSFTWRAEAVAASGPAASDPAASDPAASDPPAVPAARGPGDATPAAGPATPPGGPDAGPGGVRAGVGAAARPQRPSGAGQADLRVLVAEDNLMNQEVATLLLAAMGHDARVVDNGDDAIAAVRDGPYDVVLMDIAMPGTDGVRATRVIRGLGAAVHQPYIVALTAHAFPGDADACLEAGMDDYVAKPIDRAELARALAAAARRAAGGIAPPGPAAGQPRLDFDPSVPQRLLDEFGPASLRRLVAIFAAEATRLVAIATSAVATGDPAAAERAAHTLKSSAANLGALALQASCSSLESQARAGSVAGAADLTATMARQLADALGRLDDIASSVKSG